jgi:hypothetical protein
MKVNELSWKRLFVVFILIAATVFVVAACRRSSGGDDVPPAGDGTGGGGGGQPPQPPIVFTTPQQAAASLTTAQSGKTLVDAEFGAAMALGLSSKPAGFAAGLDKTGSGNIESIDPTLAMMVGKMGKMASSPVLRKVVQKAAALKAKRVNTFTNQAVPDSCIAGGSAVISGTNNYDDVNSTSLITQYVITFTHCRDDITVTDLDGFISIEETVSIGTNAAESNVTASLTEQSFAPVLDPDGTPALVQTFATMLEQSHIDGSFHDNNQLTAGNRTANGLFVLTIPAGASPETVTTFEYDGLDESRAVTHNADQSDTEVVRTSGNFKVTKVAGGVTASVFDLKLNLNDTMQFMNDAVGTRQNYVNGTVELARTPAVEGCQAGSMTISTDNATPRKFSTATGFTCPASGSVKINNATIKYDRVTQGAIPIQVTLDDGASQTYADCAALDLTGAACVQ